MGQPERIRTVPYHEIGEIMTLSLKENGIVGPVSRDFQRPNKTKNEIFSCCDALNS